jgi:chromosome segregation ATPase
MAQEIPKKQTGEEFFQMMSKNISETGGRLRLLEERNDQLRQKFKIIDENLINKTTDLKESVEESDAKIEEIRRDIKQLKETIEHIVKELDNVATHQELKVLEKYINMIDPTRFLTKEEVIRIIKKELGGL